MGCGRIQEGFLEEAGLIPMPVLSSSLPLLPVMIWCPPRPPNFHWLFPLPLVLWSEQDLTSATLAFCGLFPGKSISSANGCYGMSSQAFFSFGPLPSRMKTHGHTVPSTTP